MNRVDKIVFTLLFGLLLFVSLNRHSRHPRFEYHSQIFSDKAGYHVYLPAYFYYDMDGRNMPAALDSLVGRGFQLDRDKIITKYPIGVAILHAPFFGIAAALDGIQGEAEYLGYTHNQHLALNWSTAVYGTLGLLMIFLLAVREWQLSRSRAYLLVVMLLGCSNLLYYLTRDAGMSHGYLFFCYALILTLWYRFKHFQSWYALAAIIALSLLAISMRHINSVFFVVGMGYFIAEAKSQLKLINTSLWAKGVGVGLLIGSVPLILQAMYNRYAYGSAFSSGYSEESFINVLHPRLLEFWLAPNNGVLLYAPILLLALYGIARHSMYNRNVLFFAALFVLPSIIYASWWSPTLGCGFGHRGFTELLAFFSFPISLGLRDYNLSRIKFTWFVAIMVTCVLFVAQWNFDGCWYGNGAWDWNELVSLLSFQ